jgi:hypothetical protein
MAAKLILVASVIAACAASLNTTKPSVFGCSDITAAGCE